MLDRASAIDHGARVEQLPLFPTQSLTETERLLLEAYERIDSGLVDETGRQNPDGPRKQLTVAQRLCRDRLVGKGATV